MFDLNEINTQFQYLDRSDSKSSEAVYYFNSLKLYENYSPGIVERLIPYLSHSNPRTRFLLVQVLSHLFSVNNSNNVKYVAPHIQKYLLIFAKNMSELTNDVFIDHNVCYFKLTILSKLSERGYKLTPYLKKIFASFNKELLDHNELLREKLKDLFTNIFHNGENLYEYKMYFDYLKLDLVPKLNKDKILDNNSFEKLKNKIKKQTFNHEISKYNIFNNKSSLNSSKRLKHLDIIKPRL